jgi:hypothetical protein
MDNLPNPLYAPVEIDFFDRGEDLGLENRPRAAAGKIS